MRYTSGRRYTAMSRDPATAKDQLREHVSSGKPIPASLMDAAERQHREETGHHIVPTGKALIDTVMAEAGTKAPAPPGPKAEGGHEAPVGPQGEYESKAFRTARPGDVPLEDAEAAATTNVEKKKTAAKKKE